MADRPSVKDILAAARKAGAVQPSEASAAAPAEAEHEPAAAPPASPAPAAKPAVAPVPTGRPLSLKEKLAAARSNAAPAVEAGPIAPEPAVAAEPAPSVAPAAPAAPSAPAEPLGRPMTLKEKLAAARGSGTAPAPGAGASPAPKAAAPAVKASPAASTSDRPLPPLEKSEDPRDLAEHLRRTGAAKQKAAAAAKVDEKASPKGKPAPKVAESKAVPPRPSKEAALAESRGTRRGFLIGSLLTSWVVLGWASFIAGVSAFSVMLLRFMFPNVLAEPPSTIKVGLPTNFEKGEVNERWKAEWGFWIVRSDGYNGNDTLYALQSVCTHLGCPPNWLGGEQKFKCPCHGSGFYVSGVNFEGPAPRPLERFKVSLADDGQVVVDKSQKFQEELGQWSDPDSFVPMA